MLKTIETMPRGVTSLYFIQAFSTFSYAILYSSLPLYITKQISLTNSSSNSIVSLFLAFNYILQLIGGLIGGRYLSNKILFFITIIIQTIGLIFLAQCHNSTLYIGLSFFLVGCGLNTICYNSMMTQRFSPHDHRRENAFILSYGAMNIGFFAGYFASGFFDYSNQYQYLFYACMVTNAITLFLLTKSWEYLTDKNTPLMQSKNTTKLFYKKLVSVDNSSKRLNILRFISSHQKISGNKRDFCSTEGQSGFRELVVGRINMNCQQTLIGLALTLLLIPIMFLCFHSAHLSNSLVGLLSLIIFFVVFIIGFKQKTPENKHKIMAYLLLAISSILFWVLYLTGPVGITLFIKNNVDRNLGGFELATQWIKNINPLVIVLCAPLLTMLINKLTAKGYRSALSIQFVGAFLLLALSFLLLTCGIICSNNQGYTALYWVIGYVILQGISELLIAPIGFAMVGRIAPPELQGILMGTWMLVTGIAASLSHYLSDAMAKVESIDPLLTNDDFLRVFKQLSLWALIAALLLYFIVPKIRNIIEDNVSSKHENPEIVSPI